MALSSIFGGLFGGNSTPNYDASKPYMSTLAGIMQNYQNLGAGAQSQYNADSGKANNAIDQYAAYLNTDPATSQYNAAQVANAEKGASEGAQQAKSALSMDLAQRGISPNSSAGVGGLTSIDSKLADTNAGIQSQVGQNNIAQHGQNMATLASLLSGQSGQDWSKLTGALGGAGSLADTLANLTTNQANSTYQAGVQNTQADAGLLGGLGSFAHAIPWASILK